MYVVVVAVGYDCGGACVASGICVVVVCVGIWVDLAVEAWTASAEIVADACYEYVGVG